MKLKNLIDKNEYISFDIFDTLVLRNVSKSTDLFDIVENRYNSKYGSNLNFKELRISSEIIAFNCKSKEEITLEDIYIKMPIDEEKKEILKEMEIEAEIDFCQPNVEMFEIYNYCLTHNKKVIIISDMYLPQSIVEKILKKCGYENYNKLYLSSSIFKTKRTGSIFKYVLDDLKIVSSTLLHIGDNKQSDNKNARLYNINSYLYKQGGICKYYNDKKNKNVDYNILNTFIKNNLKSDDYFYKFGYSCFGPILYGYVKWLESQAKSMNIKKMNFLSRDGYIMEKAFKLLNSNIDTQYMYASRRSIIVPYFQKCSNIKEILSAIKIPSEITIKNLLKRLGLEDIDLSVILKKYDMDLENNFYVDNIDDKTKTFLDEIYPIIISNSRKEYENLIEYLKKIDFNKNLNIVDIGWYGTMQNALEKLLNVKIKGFYVGNYSNDISKYGYLIDEKNDNRLKYLLRYINAIFESCFLGAHGSVKRFADNKVEFYEYEYSDEEKECYVKLQDGALQFIKDIEKSAIKKYINLDKEVVSANIINFALYPDSEDIDNFSSITFYDNKKYKILETRGIIYYILHPLKLKKEFQNSLWKPAFVIKVFKTYAYSKHIDRRFNNE